MNNNASFLIILSIKIFGFIGIFLLREKKYDLIIALLLDDSQKYITAVCGKAIEQLSKSDFDGANALLLTLHFSSSKTMKSAFLYWRIAMANSASVLDFQSFLLKLCLQKISA